MNEKVLATGIRQRPIVVLRQRELEIAHDRGQRRAELVRDDGDQLILLTIRRQEPLVLLLELELHPSLIGHVTDERHARAAVGDHDRGETPSLRSVLCT